MKTNIFTIQILAALFLFLLINNSLLSQNVISSVNVSQNAALMSKQLTNSNLESNNSSSQFENWLSNKNYLDISSSLTEYKIILTMNEKVYEKERMLEDWMFDTSNWILKKIENDITDERHSIIDDWMSDPSFWSVKKELTREIESWMLDPQFWVLVN